MFESEVRRVSPTGSRWHRRHRGPVVGSEPRASYRTGSDEPRAADPGWVESAGWGCARERGEDYDSGAAPGRHDDEASGERLAGAAADGGAAEGAAVDGAVGQPPGSALAAALARVEAAQAAMAEVDVADEHIDVVTDAALTVQRLRNRLDADLLRLLEQVDAREGYRRSGAGTTAAWFRARTRVDPGTAQGLAVTARRLAGFPSLAAQLAAGAVTLAHVQVITRAAIPQRAEALAGCEETLVTLALLAQPAELRRAVAHVADQVDPDGTRTHRRRSTGRAGTCAGSYSCAQG